METFGYLSILTSIVLGLGLTRVMAGLGGMLQLRRTMTVDWIQLVWGLNLFLYLVLEWWILFRWHTIEQWNFFLFLFILLSPTIAFMLSVLLFPEGINAGTDVRGHFEANHHAFFLLAALLAPLDGLDTLLKGWDHFAAQGPIYIVTLLVIFGLNIVAMQSRSRRYHSFFVLFFFVYLLAFIFINLNDLQ